MARLERQLAAAVEGQSSDQAQQRLLHEEELSSLVSEHQVSAVYCFNHVIDFIFSFCCPYTYSFVDQLHHLPALCI